ncbi:MAG: hypothetical protein AABO57_24945 [Acidobacteriota bacterium]
MKIAVAGGPISGFKKSKLEPDGAAKVDCSAIGNFGIHAIHGVEGFLVIESDLSLDVIAVYTAGKGEVQSIDVEQVRERQIG